MTNPSRSLLLTDLSWVDVKAHLARESRLLIPVGTCDQYGPHLPLGAATLVAEAVADALARDFDILRAPAVPFGVNLPSERTLAGAAGIGEKTLHRLLNDLLAAWEDHGFTEFVLITAHSYDPHVEAIATISATRHARVRVLEILGIDFSEFLDGEAGRQHGGEVLTSLMLYLHPDKVNRDRIEDRPLSSIPGVRPGRPLGRLPADTGGVVGEPSLASAEKGARIFEYVLHKIRSRVFLADEPPGE